MAAAGQAGRLAPSQPRERRQLAELGGESSGVRVETEIPVMMYSGQVRGINWVRSARKAVSAGRLRAAGQRGRSRAGWSLSSLTDA